MEKVKAFIERGNDGTYGVYVDLQNNTLNYGMMYLRSYLIMVIYYRWQV